MSFLNPTLALFALACVGLPILIHLLFRRRRKPLPWGAMRFVEQAFRRHRRRLQMEQWLLLALRTLAVLVLALAVARPIFSPAPDRIAQLPRDVIILLDNSLTGQTIREGSPALDAAKKRAWAALDALDPARGDRAAVIALASPAQRVVFPPTTELSGVRRAVESVTLTDAPADFAGAALVLRELQPPQNEREQTIVIASELRVGSLNAERITAAALAQSSGIPPEVEVAMPASDEISNVAITAISPLRSVLLRGPESPATQQARVTLRRFGPDVARAATTSVRVRPRSADIEPPWTSTPLQWAPGQDTATILASFTLPATNAPAAASAAPNGPVWLEGAIDEDSLPGDNIVRVPWRDRGQIRVALVAPRESLDPASPGLLSPEGWTALALSPSTSPDELADDRQAVSLRVLDPTRVTESELRPLDAVVLARPDLMPPGSWSDLSRFAREGGLLVVLPPDLESTASWADPFVRSLSLPWRISPPPPEAAPRSVRATDAEHPLLAGLGGELTELLKPVSVRRSLVVATGPEIRPLLAMDSDAPALLASRPGESPRGLVVLMTIAPSLEWSNLPAMPLMVALMQEIVRQGVGVASGAMTVRAGEALDRPDLLRPVSPADAPALEGAARFAGVWRRVDDRGSTVELLAINPETEASSTQVQSVESLRRALSSLLRTDEIRFASPDQPSRDGAPSGVAAPHSSASRPQEPPLDLPLLLAGLVLLLIEGVLARRFSHAAAPQKPDASTLESAAPPAGREAA